eukprot:6183586-Pleurochrysis_carterae.AAC.4
MPQSAEQQDGYGEDDFEAEDGYGDEDFEAEDNLESSRTSADAAHTFEAGASCDAASATPSHMGGAPSEDNDARNTLEFVAARMNRSVKSSPRSIEHILKCDQNSNLGATTASFTLLDHSGSATHADCDRAVLEELAARMSRGANGANALGTSAAQLGGSSSDDLVIPAANCPTPTSTQTEWRRLSTPNRLAALASGYTGNKWDLELMGVLGANNAADDDELDLDDKDDDHDGYDLESKHANHAGAVSANTDLSCLLPTLPLTTPSRASPAMARKAAGRRAKEQLVLPSIGKANTGA